MDRPPRKDAVDGSACRWSSGLDKGGGGVKFTGRGMQVGARRRSVASRVLAAAGGGYALTSLLTLAVPLLLAAAGIDRAQALLATTMGSFVAYAVIVMAVFHARSATRAWIWLAGAAVPPAIVTAILLPGPVP
jgi:hypothetical protein